MSPVIHTQGLTRRFGDLTAVDTLSLDVQRGEVFGFLGHNGAGKTTTVRLLNGVLLPDSGELAVLGHDPRTDGPVLRHKTGVLTETPSLDARLTGRENLATYAEIYKVPTSQVKTRVQEMLTAFDLAERGDEKVGGYSKGMRQRLALARAFLHEPELIFLDEPTAGLDPISTRQVHDMIRRLSADEGRTVFMCTHNLVEAQRLCNRVAVMEHGRMVAVGTPTELAEQTGSGTRYAVEVAQEQIELAQKLVTGAQAVHHVEADTDRLHLTVLDREAVPELLTTLTQAGVRVYSTVPLETALEDVYMALHNGGGK